MLQTINSQVNYNPASTQTKKERAKYTKSEKFYAVQPLKVKQFNLSPINEIYYNSFESKFEGKPASWAQYKVDAGAFMETCDDIALVTVQDIQNYISKYEDKTRNNKEAHLRSLLQWIVKNNVEGAVEKVSKEMLVYLI
jgi:hypothetical protein